MNPPPATRSGAGRSRLLLTLLAVAALALAWWQMSTLARATRWYDKADASIPHVANSLALNSGVPPARFEDPGFTSEYLLALDYRVRHELGWRIWNLRRLDMSADALAGMTEVVRAGRQHSRWLVLVLILAGAGLCWRVTHSVETAGLAVMLLAGSAGLLFHGLLNRPELLAVGLASVLAPFCLWLSGSAAGARRDAWLFAAGLACGWAALAKLPAAAGLVTSFAWCWLHARAAPRADPRSSPALWLLPLAGSLATLGLLHLLASAGATPGALALRHLRIAAVAVALLPLLALVPSPWRRGAFLRARLGELALLGGGALATLPLSHLLLTAVMPGTAADYTAGLLQFVFNPLPALPDASYFATEFIRFVRASPFLFASAAVLAVGTLLRPEIPARLKAFVLLLLANGGALPVLLSHGRFEDQYSVFSQVPFLLAWAVALHGVGAWPPRGRFHWASPVALIATLLLLATVPLRLRPKFVAEDAGATGISDVTVTYLYNHNALPDPYVALMARHYPTRLGFVQALERELARPAPGAPDRP